MLPPYTYAAGRLALERSQDLMRESEYARLMRMAGLVKRGWMDRLISRLGLLVATNGERPRASSTPHTASLRDTPLETRQ